MSSHENHPDPSLKEKQEGFQAALERALTSAERAQESARGIVTRVTIFLLLDLVAIAGIFHWALIYYSYFQTYEPKAPSEPTTGMVFILLRLLAGVVPAVMIVVFIQRYVGRLKAAYARDSAYAKKVADVLREAVKPDEFPTRLEWHLFQMRLSRFDIGSSGEGESTLRKLEREAEHAALHRHLLSSKEIPAPGEATVRP